MKAMPGHSYPPVGGSSIVHAIVLAGGRGRLLHPLTADRPTRKQLLTLVSDTTLTRARERERERAEQNRADTD